MNLLGNTITSTVNTNEIYCLLIFYCLRVLFFLNVNEQSVSLFKGDHIGVDQRMNSLLQNSDLN